jgi:transposase InsO family protein
MSRQADLPRIDLPRGWPRYVRSAMLHVIALAQYAVTYARSWAINGRIARVRLKARNDQLRQEVALLTEEIRIKDARMKRVDRQKRPHYVPTERMAILELRAARAWSAQQIAETFLVTAATIASWMKRVDEEGANALVQIREPVNKFPDFVRYAVQRLKALCPMLGKAKIAKMLCRAGLHLGTTTMGRILKEPPRPMPSEAVGSSDHVVTAKRANHVWHIDLTTVPTGAGFWASWLPFALPPCWPFCWWLALVIDHYSRRPVGFSVFPKRPKSLAMRSFLGRMIASANATPKYLICDQDSIFWCAGFERWCRRKRIRPRYGAVGQHGSIARIERFIRTMKDEGTRRILVPQRQADFQHGVSNFFSWYNEWRPHAALEGRTPNEVYFRLRPANRRPRIEPRKRWPRNAPCAGPRTLIAGRPGNRFTLEVGFHAGQRQLPIISLKRAA